MIFQIDSAVFRAFGCPIAHVAGDILKVPSSAADGRTDKPTTIRWSPSDCGSKTDPMELESTRYVSQADWTQTSLRCSPPAEAATRKVVLRRGD